MEQDTKFKTGVLLINLGTPENCDVKSIRKYLGEFLSDPKVIDINPVLRFLLLNLIILPSRPKKILGSYKSIWLEKGSPLLVYGLEVKEALQKELGDSYDVEFAMRYGNPNLEEALKNFNNPAYSSLIIVPLFPQYAEATTGSVFEIIMRQIKDWHSFPQLKMISNFYHDQNFIDCFVELGKKYLAKEKYDHILFSFHSLPANQVKKADQMNFCQLNDSCCQTISQKNQFCYRAQCIDTAKKIAEKLGLEKNNYSISFQSRLGRADWIRPYSDEVIIKLAEQGCKKLLVFSPAFVADCLETTFEIGTEYKHLFQEKGGEQLDLVESLNAGENWIKALKEIVLK